MAEAHNTKLLTVTENLLKNLNVLFTPSALKAKLENNPYYPSLFSVSEVFNDYNIENKGMEIEISELDKLPVPFLAYTTLHEIGSKDFVTVSAVKDKTVTYYHGKEKTVSREEFIINWTGVVLLVEKSEDSKEQDYETNLKKTKQHQQRIIALSSGLAILVIGAIYMYATQATNIFSALSILLFALAGLFVSVLLLIYEIDKSNAFVKNICTGGTQVNCDAVLGSKASKLFGISWGEIGFFYFSAFALFLLNPLISFQEKNPYLTYISILAATYMPFSIYYQYKVVKQWCKLCLMVQAVLLVNLIWSLTTGSFDPAFTMPSAVLFLVSIAIPMLAWYSIKPILVKSNDADRYYGAYKRLINQPAVLQASLLEQPDLLEGWENLNPIIKGNPDAENIILKSCKPLCLHCFKAHAIFNDILNKNNNVKIVTVFLIHDDDGDEIRLPAKHFLALAEMGRAKEMEEAMNEWYLNEDRNYNVLANKYPVTQEMLAKQTDKILRMTEWCDAAEIEYTPTVFVNGKKLPSTFLVSDLRDVF
jgi:uncharacterized membrane protein